MRLRLANEIIDFQRNDNFGRELEIVIEEMRQFIEDYNKDGYDYYEIRDALQESDLPDKLSKIIYARLGIKTKIVVDTDVYFSTLTLWINRYHIFLHESLHDNFDLPDQNRFMKENLNNKGWIDLKRAKVGGVFSKYNHRIFINIVELILYGLDYTNRELVAILLHEIGHIFNTLEYSNRLESTNQVLQNLATNIKNNGSKTERIYLLKELQELSDEFNIDDLEKEDNRFIFGVKLFREYFKIIKSQLPNKKYDETSSEQLADSFVARFGYGEDLITALHKDDTFYYDEIREFDSIFATLTFAEKTAFSFYVVFLLKIPFPILFKLISFIIVSFILLYKQGEQFVNYSYDEIKVRYKRIRQQYIEMLTQLKLSKEEMKKIIANVEFIDKAIKNIAPHKSLLNSLSNMIFSKNKYTKADIELQQFIEDLTHNDLFLASAKLQTLELPK